MSARALRLVGMMVRPPVAFVVVLFALIGMAQAGRADGIEPVLVAVVLAGWFIHATSLNDLGDEAIDRVNLVGAPGRPLVSGDATRGELRALGRAAALFALAGGVAIDIRVGLVIAAGLLLNAAYSCRPVRLCDRGIVAPLVLPAGYVAVPYLAGAFAVRPALRPSGALLLAGLYVGFTGRIVLKDFRDVRGDARFGKRTFLLRYGRVRTCQLSGAAWVIGTAVMLVAVPASPALVVAFVALLALALHGLRRLASAPSREAQQAAIGGMAMAGRGMAVVLFAHLSMLDHGWLPATATATVAIIALAALFALGVGRAAVVEKKQWGTRSRVPRPTVRARVPG